MTTLPKSPSPCPPPIVTNHCSSSGQAASNFTDSSSVWCSPSRSGNNPEGMANWAPGPEFEELARASCEDCLVGREWARLFFGIIGDGGGTAGDCLRDADFLLPMRFVGLSWDDDREVCVVKDVAVAASPLLPEIVAATVFVVVVVIVTGFCPMLSGRPFIQDVRGLETPTDVDVFFWISLPRSCSSTFSAALALLARRVWEMIAGGADDRGDSVAPKGTISSGTENNPGRPGDGSSGAVL